MFGVTVVTQAAIAGIGVPSYAIWNNSPTLLLCAVAFLELILRMPHIPSIAEKVCHSVAKYSFGIYLMHMPILMMLQRYIQFNNIKGLGALFVLFVITFIVSFGVVGIVRKNRTLRQYLFLK